VDDPRKNRVRPKSKEMPIVSSRKVLREEAIPCFVHILHEYPVTQGK